MIQVSAHLLQARKGAEGHTHPIGIRQSLAFSFSTRREVIFPGFPLSARDMDSTLRRQQRRSSPSGLPRGSSASHESWETARRPWETQQVAWKP